MSYNTELQENNAELEAILEEVEALPDADPSGNGLTFDKFPTVEEINALENWSYFRTKGFHTANDGLGSVYQVKNSAGTFYVPYGNMYFRPVEVDWNYPDINVDLYGIRRGSADYAQRNSEIMAALASTIQNGCTLRFASGHYYFAEPIPHMEKHVIIKGVASNATPMTNVVNYGTHLHFPNLTDGQCAISIAGGVVQDIGIIGNPNICDVSFSRIKLPTDLNDVVTLVDNGTTYGIKFGEWGYTAQNVRVINFTFGIYGETCNSLLTNCCALKCKVGMSVGNDGKISDIQVTNVVVGLEMRGHLVNANNIRGDSVGKHVIECKKGRCMLSNIDGDFCMGSLIHYGGDGGYIYLGQATNCTGRVAAKYAFARGTTFDLRNIPTEDYEYCSYISIAPNMMVLGGMIDVSNINSDIFDTASNYVHPNSILSIGVGSTVKDVIIKGNVPGNADAEYFSRNVILNLSNYANYGEGDKNYIANFDGETIEDIAFITASGFMRSVRTMTEKNRVIVKATPQKGVDYWTEDEIAEIRTYINDTIAEILENMPTEPTDKTLLYSLKEPVTFSNATPSILDTRVRVFDTAKDFTLLIHYSVGSVINLATLLTTNNNDGVWPPAGMHISTSGEYIQLAAHKTNFKGDGANWKHIMENVDTIAIVFTAGIPTLTKFREINGTVRTWAIPSGITFTATNGTLTLGAQTNNTAGFYTNGFDGTVKDFRVWNVAKTEIEIDDLLYELSQ